MDNNTFSQINDLISQHENVGVATGSNPSLDTMGASLGLFLSLKQIGKNVSVASPTLPNVGISSLVGIDEVRSEFAGEGGDLVVSFPYQEGAIEKVSYNLDEQDGFLNIIVKAGEQGLQFDEQDVRFKRSGALPTLLFVIGTKSLQDLGSLYDPEALKDTTIVNIDNKQSNQSFGDIALVSQEFSSVSEQVGHFLLNLDLPLDADIAQDLLSGISFATNNFQDAGTSAVAFEMAGMLMRRGAQRPQLASDNNQQNQEAGSNLVRLREQRQQHQQQRQQTQPKQVPRPPRPQQNQGAQNQSFQAHGSQNQDRSNYIREQLQRMQQKRQQQAQKDQSKQPEKVQEKTEVVDEKDAPDDWLQPKVYKGSTQVS